MKQKISILYPAYLATYISQPSHIILYPQNTIKQAFLLKHPSIINIQQFKQVDIDGMKSQAALVPFISDINLQGPSLLIGLKSLLEAVTFIYQNNMQLSQFSLHTLKLQQNKIVFIALDTITQNGLSEQQLCDIIKTEFQTLKQLKIIFNSTFEKTLNQQQLKTDLFEIISNFQTPDIIQKISFLNQLNLLSKTQSNEVLEQFILIPFFNALKQMKQPTVDMFTTFANLINASLPNLQVQILEYYFQQLINSPSLLQSIASIKNIENFNDNHKKPLQHLLTWAFSKTNNTSQILELQLLCSQIFSKNCEYLIEKHNQKQFFNSIQALLLRTQKLQNYHISWNIWIGLINLIKLYDNLRSKSTNFEEIQQNNFTGLSEQVFIDYFKTACLQSLNAYDCPVAAVCMCNKETISLLNLQDLFLFTNALHQQYSLENLVYSVDEKRRELGQKFVSMLDFRIKQLVQVKDSQVVLQVQNQNEKLLENVIIQNQYKELQQVEKTTAQNIILKNNQDKWDDTESEQEEIVIKSKNNIQWDDSSD
ncbi:hypothetical protein SS50377_26343 [Spironucleus salmonicida]|uniref:Uncharacterized protein n=1 Tax=Spironucleus salmonicida TaxID=348837 RepID=V6M3D3_9EUKA|nr:hypothetical protein SS50377_26343 [Spironucleus salmonicida]|eukprot:EST47789.1 Hypothetical protein SS50377_12189 [Spironucleus salmonicida]